MMNKITFSIFGIILISLIILPSICLADKPRVPISYKTNLEDGTHVFVMLAENKKPITNSDGMEYPNSGLYQNNSINPVYTVDWYAFEDNLVISNDGTYIAKVAPCAISYKKGEAITFYNQGELIKRYNISNLINDVDNLEPTVSHYIWRNCSIRDWTEDNEEAFYINTVEDAMPRGFFLKTGKPKYLVIDDRAEREERMEERIKLKNFAIYGIPIIIIVAGIVIFYRKSIKKKYK